MAAPGKQAVLVEADALNTEIEAHEFNVDDSHVQEAVADANNNALL